MKNIAFSWVSLSELVQRSRHAYCRWARALCGPRTAPAAAWAPDKLLFLLIGLAQGKLMKSKQQIVVQDFFLQDF